MNTLALTPLVEATLQTLYMVFLASFIGIIGGTFLGVLLFLTDKEQQKFHQTLNKTLGFIVNALRSIPFIILLISIIPLTRLIVGTAIGTNAAVVPLALAAIPYFARICESSLKEVPAGLIEASHAMGVSVKQLVFKVLLPESLPSLIRGGTLTVIGLIGYSAMAGVVGGGGLGELAINYGYQRFNPVVMLETVVLLIIMVQLLQMLGDYLAKVRGTKILFSITFIGLLICFISQIWPQASHENALKVGVMSGQAEEVMQVAKSVAEKDYHLKLIIVNFDDYVLPNTALDNGSIDANIFQHVPYLEAQIQARGLKIMPLANTFVYPMGFYSTKITALSQLKRNDVVAIPSDPSNEARSLLLLQKANLITLTKGVSTLASVKDIVQNSLELQFKTLDASQLPRVLPDATLVAITNDYLGPTQLTLDNALLKEGSDSAYVNVIVIRVSDKDNPLYQKLVETMHSQEVIQATQKLYPHGGAIPGW